MRGALVAAVLGALSGAAIGAQAVPDSRSVLCFGTERDAPTVEIDLDGGFQRAPGDFVFQIHGKQYDGPGSSSGPFTPRRSRRTRGDVVTYHGEQRRLVTFIVRARFEGDTLTRFGATYRHRGQGSRSFPRRLRLSDVTAVEIRPAE